MNLPIGTVTFLFTDIEGSTKLWEEQPDTMRLALARHDALLRAAIETHGGTVFKTIGDAFCAAFSTAPEALEAALMAQQSLHQVKVGVGSELMLKVRMAIHTGTPEQRDGDYFGQPLNRVARLLAAGHGGQVLLSDVTQELTRDLLPRSVGLKSLGEHRLQDLGRPEHIYQLLHPDLPSEFAPLKSLDNPELPNNLPQQVTSFIGREKEIQAVKSLLGKTRLLTLTGSGGCGKTRLGLQVAAEVLEHHPQGVWLVELAPLFDPGLVAQEVASVLGLREEPGKPILQTLVDALKARRLLLVLDNCEHLLAACAQLADALLKNCPHVQMLASSREALGIAGEQTYRIPSLSLPDTRQVQTVESLSQYEAVRLFIERAVSVQSQFTVTNASAPALAQLCVRLDGIPLAIELAAARVRSLAVEEINARLDNCFRLLTGGSRTTLPRQQTLRALMDWSYDLLKDQEKMLLCRLCAFAGGWTLEAAEAVGAGDEVEGWEVLDLLTSLVDKSLVLAEQEQGQTRYRLLETIRRYAGDRLSESGEGESVRERHQGFFVGLAEEAEPQLVGSEQAAWLYRLEQEHDNLRAALEWSNKEAALRIAGSLWLFWQVRGYLSEGRERLTGVLAAADTQANTPARANALRGAGELTRSQGDYAASQTLFQECLALYQESGDKQGIAASLNGLGIIAHCQGDYAGARRLFEESLTLKRELGDKQGIAWSLANLGNVAHDQGDLVAARTLREESLTIQRELGDKQGIAWSLHGLGNVAYEKGDYDGAQTLFEESLTIRRELGNKVGIADSLANLGNVAREQGDYTGACTLFEESLALMRELGNKAGLAALLDGFSALASAQEQSKRAAILWGAAAALREQIGAPLRIPTYCRGDYDRHLEAVRSAMSEEAFAAAWAKGRAVTMEQAIEYALEDAAA